MEQEITVSENLFDYLSNNITFEKNGASACIDVISDNSIVDDKYGSVFKNYEKFIGSLNDEKLIQFFKKVFKYWLNNSKRLEVTSQSNKVIDLFKLCSFSKDKIYFNPELDSNQMIELSKNYTDIEFHNIKTIVRPRIEDRLKNVPLKIKLIQNQSLNLNHILEPFIRNTRSVTIYDPYITGKNNFYNFKNFCSILPEKTIIRIFTYKKETEEHFNSHRFFSFINDLKRKEYSVNVEYFKITKHIERYIVTDNYEIYLPGGFNCIDRNGFPVISEDQYKKVITIEKKE